MLTPVIDSWMEKSDKISSHGYDPAHIASFEPVTVHAGKSQVPYFSLTMMFDGYDMLNLEQVARL
jgi:hypothetical protein